MDEMKMNETTVMENENSVEVVPEENVQMIENEETSGMNLKLAICMAAIAGVAVIGEIKHLKNKKSKTEEDKPKAKKKIHLRAPWTVEEVVEPDVENVSENVEETSEEE